VDMTQYAGKEGQYLKADDFTGKRFDVRISAVEMVAFDTDDGEEIKPALAFKGKDKKLVLNPTNTKEIIRAFGKESDEWIGQKLMITVKYYESFGKSGFLVAPITEEEEEDEDIPF